MSSLNIIFFSLLLSSIASANDEKMCSKRKTYFLQQKRELKSSLLKTFKKETDIILIGVEHFNYESEVYPEIVNALADADIHPDCFFLETELSNNERMLLRMANSGQSVDLKQVAEYLKFGDFLNFLSEKKIKIFDVDMNLAITDFNEWLNLRDNEMYSKILKFHRSSHCKLSVFPVGALHISSGQSNRITLSEHLEKNGLNVFKIGLSIQGQLSSHPMFPGGPPAEASLSSSWAWLKKSNITQAEILNLNVEDFVCPEVPALSDTTYTINQSAKGNVPSIYLNSTKTFVGSMNDMSFWIYYQCKDLSCRGSNHMITEDLQRIGIGTYPSFSPIKTEP